MKNEQNIQKEIYALKVRQWLPEWNSIRWDKAAKQGEPQHHFFLCSIRAGYLKALTGVYRRSTKDGLARTKDPNVQRGHERERSHTIQEFVKYGYPWCEMTESRRKAPGAEDLRKPGWLPGAILVNILPPESKRSNGQKISNRDLITIEEKNDLLKLKLPESFSGTGWEPETIFPLEVIDGQHRLWAFDGFDPGDDFDLPVVAFYGLDTSWQAYLFWSVNITPKRINKSLAFDLYPLLRKEDWLDKFEGHSIYRETRCQELVEALWLNERSPWCQLINMLGESKSQRENSMPMVTQAAWIRSLMATLVRAWEGRGTRIGGLFGAPTGKHETFLPWDRSMQAAFLIFASMKLRDSIKSSQFPWAVDLRSKTQPDLSGDDLVFYGKYSLLTTDQGIRGFLFIINDLCFIDSKRLDLKSWTWESVESTIPPKARTATDENELDKAIESISTHKLAIFLDEIATGLSSYDWRASSTPDLSEADRLHQSVFRGGSGYKEMRRQLLVHLSHFENDSGKAAKEVLSILSTKK